MPVEYEEKKKLTLYTLEEMLADKELKKNLLQANQESDHFIDTVLSDYSDDLVRELENRGFHNVKIYYDLSCCQGSGACFDFEGCNVFKIAKYYKGIRPYVNQLKFCFKDIARRGKLSHLETYSDFKTLKNQFANLYCHRRTRRIDYTLPSSFDSIEKEDYKQINESLREFYNEFDKLYLDICSDIYSKMMKEYEYHTSDDFLIEDLRAREDISYFTADGKIYPGLNTYTYPKKEDSKIVQELDKFVSEENKDDNYVITDADGKIFCYPQKGEDIREGYFLDTSDDEDLGFRKAILMTKEEAKDFIVEYLQDQYDIESVEQVFKKR